MAVKIDTNRPSSRTVIISLIVVALAIIGALTRVQFLTEYHFLIALIAYAVLLAGVLFKGL
jgi:hypothetical protein